MRWRLQDVSLVPVMTDEEPAQDNIMQLSSDVKESMKWKQCFCHSNGLKYMAACRVCRGAECQNSVISELLAEGQNGIEDRFDNNYFDNVFILLFFANL